ncbi:hypothetical protein ACFLZF_00505, partial [Nanoarchaeota archaeon]
MVIEQRENFFKEHIFLIPILIMILIVGAFLVSQVPELPGPKVLEKSYVLFGLSLNTVILLFAISFVLLSRYMDGGDKTTLVWGLSFLISSITFIALALRSLGFSWANESTPFLFFIYRNVMILWVAGIYYGLSLVMVKSKKLQIIPSFIILIVGYLWFIYGLFFIKDIEYTMYGFLYFLFIPLCISLSYLFYKQGKREQAKSMKFISLGFLITGLMYMTWAPWHNNFFYYNCFFIYTLGLVFIFVGIFGLPYERVSRRVIVKGNNVQVTNGKKLQEDKNIYRWD